MKRNSSALAYASLFGTCMVLCFAGCHRAGVAEGDSDTASPVTTPGDPDAAPPTADAASVEVASWEEIEQVIRDSDVPCVVLDIWSIYCPPCIEELPGLAKLAEKYESYQLTCLTLNCSFTGRGTPEDEVVLAQKVLHKHAVACRSFTTREPDEELYEKLGIAAVPVVRVYGKGGVLLKQFDNEQLEYGSDGFSYEKDIIPFINTILLPTP